MNTIKQNSDSDHQTYYQNNNFNFPENPKFFKKHQNNFPYPNMGTIIETNDSKISNQINHKSKYKFEEASIQELSNYQMMDLMDKTPNNILSSDEEDEIEENPKNLPIKNPKNIDSPTLNKVFGKAQLEIMLNSDFGKSLPDFNKPNRGMEISSAFLTHINKKSEIIRQFSKDLDVSEMSILKHLNTDRKDNLKDEIITESIENKQNIDDSFFNNEKEFFPGGLKKQLESVAKKIEKEFNNGISCEITKEMKENDKKIIEENRNLNKINFKMNNLYQSPTALRKNSIRSDKNINSPPISSTQINKKKESIHNQNSAKKKMSEINKDYEEKTREIYLNKNNKEITNNNNNYNDNYNKNNDKKIDYVKNKKNQNISDMSQISIMLPNKLDEFENGRISIIPQSFEIEKMSAHNKYIKPNSMREIKSKISDDNIYKSTKLSENELRYFNNVLDTQRNSENFIYNEKNQIFTKKKNVKENEEISILCMDCEKNINFKDIDYHTRNCVGEMIERKSNRVIMKNEKEMKILNENMNKLLELLDEKIRQFSKSVEFNAIILVNIEECVILIKEIVKIEVFILITKKIKKMEGLIALIQKENLKMFSSLLTLLNRLLYLCKEKSFKSKFIIKENERNKDMSMIFLADNTIENVPINNTIDYCNKLLEELDKIDKETTNKKIELNFIKKNSSNSELGFPLSDKNSENNFYKDDEENKKRIFYSEASAIKLSLPYDHPYKDTIIADLFKECNKLRIPQEKWQDFIKKKLGIKK